MLKIVSAMFLFLILFTGFTPDALPEIDIDVAPNVLNLANQGQVVTIHTDIPYSWVASDIYDEFDNVKVFLNDIPIDWRKSDDQGNFVANFNIDDVKGLVANYQLPVELPLTLVWNSATYGICSGTQIIKFIDVSAAGKK